MVFDIDVHNPNAASIKVGRFKYAVDIEGTEFLKSETPAEVDLPALGTGRISIPARFGYRELMQARRALADKSEAGYELRAAFPISVLGQSYDIPVHHQGTVPILRLPGVVIKRFDASTISWTGARVVAEATVRNTNAFPLGMRQVRYLLKVGDMPVVNMTASAADSIAAGGSGKVSFTGEVTARPILQQLLQGVRPGQARVSISGAVETPYGVVPVDLHAGD